MEDITELAIQNELCTKDIPDPELMIRTSGEHRISNFLLWQPGLCGVLFYRKAMARFP